MKFDIADTVQMRDGRVVFVTDFCKEENIFMGWVTPYSVPTARVVSDASEVVAVLTDQVV